ncbi:MAG TPA: hypothetical protein VG755_04445, partial [Nannocystaceae bacterium]|nr:hypothetical protein [Nannocystaceae bacterium]
CPTLVNDCTGDGGGGSGGGSCDHDVCEEGGPLQPSCGSCAADICQIDEYCCNSGWDATCIQEVEQYCAGGCGGGQGGSCAHDECSTGAALDETCSSCTSAVCSADPFCCQTEWDDVCVGEVATECGEDCGGGGGGCIHDECEQGGPLTSACSSCADTVCGVDDFCCTTDWDATCVQEADDYCGGICGGGGGVGCAHDECAQGGPLDALCSDCAQAVCDADPVCCDEVWDDICVGEADQFCGC